MMEAQRMSLATRLPGFRFSPTDVELISFYLKQKLEGSEKSVEVIPQIDICRYEPWDLPEKAVIQSDNEWFFFSHRGRKYPNGSQSKRATEFGYWKATGKERNVKSNMNVIGTKRTLVFHLGRAPKGQRTEWIMHEYCMPENSQDPLVVCRLRKNGDFRTSESSHQDYGRQRSLSITSSNTNQEGCADGASQQYAHLVVSDSNGCLKKRSTSHFSYSIEQNGDGFESDCKVPQVANPRNGGFESDRYVPQDACQPESSSCHQGCNNDDFYADILNDDIVQLFTESSLTTSPSQPVTSIYNRRTVAESSRFPSQGIARRRMRLNTSKIDFDALEMKLNRPKKQHIVGNLTPGRLSGIILISLLIIATLSALFH